MTSPHLPLDESAAERAWQAQEMAMREERSGESGPMRGYRPLMRALRHWSSEVLPEDFAARMELLAMLEHGTLDRPGRRFQLDLGIATGGFLALALGGISALYGKLWLTPVLTLAETTTSHAPWLLALLSGIAFSAFANFWRRAGFSRR